MIRINFYLSGVYFNVVKTTMEIFEMLENCTTNDLLICNTTIEDESSIEPLKYNKQYEWNPCLSQGIYVVSINWTQDNLSMPDYTRIDELKDVKNMDILDVVYVDHQYVLDYERVHCF